MTDSRHHRFNRRALAALIVAGLTGGACATADPMPTSAPVRSAASSMALSDADIAAIVVAANAIDVQMGELALARSANAEVRKFAQQMITDHNAVNQSAVALVTRLGVTPTESATSSSLKASAEQTRVRVSGLSGAAFDRAYVDNEVAYHQTVLNALDNALVPNARNAELKSTLISVRPAFVAHLQHAQHLQSSLQGGSH